MTDSKPARYDTPTAIEAYRRAVEILATQNAPVRPRLLTALEALQALQPDDVPASISAEHRRLWAAILSVTDSTGRGQITAFILSLSEVKIAELARSIVASYVELNQSDA